MQPGGGGEGGGGDVGLGVSIRDLCSHITLAHCMHITLLTHRLTENRLAGLSSSSQRFSLLGFIYLPNSIQVLALDKNNKILFHRLN